MEQELIKWLGIGVLAFFSTVIVIAIFYFDYKKAQVTQNQKVDPLIKAVLITFGSVALVAGLEFTGVLNKGFTKDHTWVFFLVFVGAVLIYYYVERQRLPMKLDKQYKIVLEWLNFFYGSHPFINSATITPLKLYKVTSGKYDVSSEGDISNWLVSLQSGMQIREEYLFKLNIFTGQVLQIQEKPSSFERDLLKGEKISLKKNSITNSFDEAPDTIMQQKNSEAQR